MNMLGIFSRAAWPVLLLLCSALPFAAGFGDFHYLFGAEFSDLTISHLPNLLFLRRALVEFKSIPLWSPAILSGFPFFANPLSGLWYPPGWLAVVWPQAWAFNLLAGLHLAWGGLGMRKMLQREGLPDVPAWIAALAFAMLPKLLAHIGAGHISLVYAVSWTPWLFLVSGSRERLLSRPGVVLAVVFYADPRWAAYAGLAWLAYEIVHRQKWAGVSVGKGRVTARLAGELVLSLVLSAPLLLPLLEFTSLSTRRYLEAGDVLAFSLPPSRLLGMLFPDFGGMAEWTVYPGAASLALAAVGIFGVCDYKWPGRVRSRRFWVGMSLAALLFSLGDAIPLLRLWSGIPGANLLRVPPRAMFLFGLAGSALAGYGLENLLAWPRKDPGAGSEGSPAGPRWAANLLLAGLGFFWLAFSLVVWVVAKSLPISFLWGSAAGLSMLAGIVAVKRFGRDRTWPVLLVFLLIILDLSAVNFSTLSRRTPQQVFSQGEKLARWLSERPGSFRVYSPSYSLPQHTAALYGLELADGVDPLQIQSYAQAMARAGGYPIESYSVTLPPFEDGDIATANAEYLPNARLLGEWNVGYVVSDFEINAAGLDPEAEIGGVHVYRNMRNLPRAVDLATDSPVPYHWSPNRIIFNVEGRKGPLDYSLPAYPYWQVLADGETRPGMEWLTDLKRIPIPQGARTLEVVFMPLSLYAGIGLFLLGAGWLVFRKNEGS